MNFLESAHEGVKDILAPVREFNLFRALLGAH